VSAYDLTRKSKTGYLIRAGVLRKHRGQGLQRRFVRVREARARKNGWTSMVTDTTGATTSSNNLIRCGYRIFVPKRPWFAPETIYWSKQL
jgi:GNAT superfamily N-acetyltransferase